MGKIKLVACDVDGTLIDETEKINGELLSIKAECEKREIVFTLITGRTYSLVSSIVNALGVSSPYIVSNGAAIYQGQNCLISCDFSAFPILSTIQEAHKNGITVSLGDTFQERLLHATPYAEKHMKMGRYEAFIDIESFDWKREKFQKILFYDDKGIGFMNKLQKIFHPLRENYSFVWYGDIAVEIGAKGVNKSYGLKNLCNLIGVKREEIMAIGDSANDIEMLSWAGIGVAVANATENARKAAKYVTKSPMYYGVLEAINKFCFGGEQ